ncbi:hypothetical protein TRICI_003441 [Trichomonascus ciferrii]|uniref:alcohol oxidase n=1 Tax=Trichomonascus ciferrii TaxID=44093 RepID=A0A642V8X8_9ASCO|nr:hypothetical protein TRICI_003441 [Trichomonascus ciferrii]
MVVSHYDFIVVGGGTAGSVVAGRLAENPDVSVLVIEAGPGNSVDIEEIRTPAVAMELRRSQYDWAYKTTMVKRDDYERIEKPNTRGKALGGSSSLNYFSWVPGSKYTFDLWEKYGGKEWTWDPLVPYLRKSATYHDDAKLFSTDLSKIGTGGPIDIAHADLLPEMEGFRDAVTKSWKSTGEPTSENIFDGEMRGVAVIGPNGKEQKLYARREVIVSQGVFESPKLLMLSGIGPAKELKRHGIDVVVDSRHVGEHLLDHPGVPFVLKVDDAFGMEEYLAREGSSKNKDTVSAYKNGHKGPLGSPLLELIGFPRIDKYLEKDPVYRQAKASNGGKDPFCPGGQPHFELDFVCMFGSAFQWHYPLPKTGSHTTVMVDLVRPVGPGGTVKLNSDDPLEQPDINLNYFADDLDIIAMREGIRYSYDVLKNAEPFKSHVIAEYPWDMPLDDDEKMKNAILDRVQTSFHPCGTARLSKSIEQGVVDPGLRVHGIKNLRVIDASVIPEIPDCRIQNSVYMIGEKGADLIKADHKDLYKN